MKNNKNIFIHTKLTNMKLFDIYTNTYSMRTTESKSYDKLLSFIREKFDEEDLLTAEEYINSAMEDVKIDGFFQGAEALLTLHMELLNRKAN